MESPQQRTLKVKAMIEMSYLEGTLSTWEHETLVKYGKETDMVYERDFQNEKTSADRKESFPNFVRGIQVQLKRKATGCKEFEMIWQTNTTSTLYI